jgi:hypothetical protein
LGFSLFRSRRTKRLPTIANIGDQASLERHALTRAAFERIEMTLQELTRTLRDDRVGRLRAEFGSPWLSLRKMIPPKSALA